MKNKFAILVFSSIIIGYSVLPAKTPKKFTDTVILKNGKVLSGIRATDSILVTTEDGVTTIYKKKDTSEVKKEKSLAVGRWSDYQGAMRWEDAIAFCLGDTVGVDFWKNKKY